MNLANHLHYADHVIFLNEEGCIARQGTLESMSEDEDIQKLTAQPPATTSRPKLELTDEALTELEAVENNEPNTGRPAGDLKIYAYYAKVAGWWNVTLYLFAGATFVFGVTFPR